MNVAIYQHVCHQSVCVLDVGNNKSGQINMSLLLIVFRSGHDYFYRYESQLLSGIPSSSSQSSGVKINALVKLQFQRNDVVIMQVTTNLDHGCAEESVFFRTAIVIRCLLRISGRKFLQMCANYRLVTIDRIL